MHFEMAGVLKPALSIRSEEGEEDMPLLSKISPSLEHQNLRVESAVPGYHALLLEHQQQSIEHGSDGSGDDAGEAMEAAAEAAGGSGLTEPLLLGEVTSL